MSYTVPIFGGIEDIATTVVTENQIGTVPVTLPKTCRQIVSMRPFVNIAVPALNEEVLVKFRISSDDLPNVSPFEVLASPISATGITALGAPYKDQAPVYHMAVPCSGGERITPYATVLVSCTPVVYVGVEFTISDMPPTTSQKHAKVGTVTSTGAAATLTPGTAYQISGCSRIIELMGAVNTTTTIAADDVFGYFKWTSSEFRTSVPVEMMAEPLTGIVGATGSAGSRLNRRNVSIDVMSPCTLQDSFTASYVPGTAGKFITGIVYE